MFYRGSTPFLNSGLGFTLCDKNLSWPLVDVSFPLSLMVLTSDSYKCNGKDKLDSVAKRLAGYVILTGAS